MLSDILAMKAKDAAMNENLKIINYLVGAKYSYVVVEGPLGSAMGVAYMPFEDMGRGMAREPEIDNLPNLVSSLNLQEKSLGISAVNAVSQYLLWNAGSYGGRIEYGDVVENISDCCPRGRIVVVGNMIPLVKKLSARGEVIVLERNPRLRVGAYPDTLAPRVIPSANVVVITGAALVNDSIDYLLSLSADADLRILVGPTAGAYPEWLRGQVDIVASMRIEKIGEVSEVIRRGGGRWDLSEFATDYVARL